VGTAVARFGPFDVVSRIGFGGMGEVFRARYRGERGEPDIALKLIKPEHASNPRFRQMFLAEARISVLLDHPNIACLVDCGDVDGVLYLANELVEGICLHRLMNAGPFPFDVMGYILGALLDALDYAHNLCDADGRPLGLVHRDVTPGNVLLSRTGEVKLADFGVHKAAGGPMTYTGEVKGKPAFMAPEQLPGQSAVDCRADLFAVGVMLHVAAMGRPPFTDVATWLSAGAPLSVDGALADLITLALAPDPAHRFASARELATALRRVLPGRADAAIDLARRVRELEAAERPLNEMERLLMSEIEPSALFYAPDLSTGRLWVVGPLRQAAAPLPSLAFDDGGTPTRTFESAPTAQFMGPTDRTSSLTPTPDPSAFTPTPLMALVPEAKKTPADPSAITPTPILRREPMPLMPTVLTPTPTPLVALGSDPLSLDPVPRRRRWPLLVGAILTMGAGASVVAAVLGVEAEWHEPKAPPGEVAPSAPVAPAPTTATPTTPPELPPETRTPPRVAAPTLEPPPEVLLAPAPPEPPPKAAAAASPPARPASTARARAHPTRAAADSPIGYLTLDTDPWAIVYLGSREIGTTPFMRVPLPAGRQQLTFDVQGSGRRVRRPVEIPPGGLKRLALQLR
jgi:serine/threonine-protein kinase